VLGLITFLVHHTECLLQDWQRLGQLYWQIKCKKSSTEAGVP